MGFACLKTTYEHIELSEHGSPVISGTNMKITELVLAKAEIVWQNQDGVTVMESVLTGILPGVPEREVMMAMIAEGDPTNKLTQK